ncbi:Pol-like protein [Elysia marginata]|uniref:Pol-like protein n=1 Tax=Elysia marginata TaxID=1093978 RepID=A0AAV4FXD9_9GAST|nr:Pol-like protein [Elysia marginata]
MKFDTSFGIICALICAVIQKSYQSRSYDNEYNSKTQPAIFYSPAVLKSLLSFSAALSAVDKSRIPPEVRLRKRGKKDGVRARFRRRSFRPPLPAIVNGNIQSLDNKLDELSTNCRFSYICIREAGLICLTETWLNQTVPKSVIDIDKFTLYRSGRSLASGKTRGGGVCDYVNDRWCTTNNTHVIKTLCTPDIKLLALSLRPVYLPQEFPKINLLVTYIPPNVDSEQAIQASEQVFDTCLRNKPTDFYAGLNALVEIRKSTPKPSDYWRAPRKCYIAKDHGSPS